MTLSIRQPLTRGYFPREKFHAISFNFAVKFHSPMRHCSRSRSRQRIPIIEPIEIGKISQRVPILLNAFRATNENQTIVERSCREAKTKLEIGMKIKHPIGCRSDIHDAGNRYIG